MNAKLRLILAGVAAVVLTFAFNHLALAWLRGTIFEDPSFYDGSALVVTLALPALVAGMVSGWIGREQGMNVASVAFILWTIAGFVHPFWAIPSVSPQSAHSGLMHYFLYNPLVALAFGTLGGWLGGQFGAGRFTLSDREPLVAAGLEED